MPADVREGWSDSSEVYRLSRNYFYAIHKKREKILETINKENLDLREQEDTTEIIIRLYENL